MESFAKRKNLLSITFDDLIRHLPRSVIIVITMTLGVSVMSCVLFLGRGGMSQLWQEIDDIVGNRLEILANHASVDPYGPAQRYSTSLLEEDVDALIDDLPDDRLVCPVFTRSSVPATTTHVKSSIFLEGAGERLLTNSAYRILAGRPMSEQRVAALSGECLISTTTRDQFFPGEEAVGRELFVGGKSCRVVGVIPDIPTTASWRIARVVLPIDAARMEFGSHGEISAVLVFWSSPEGMEETLARVRQVMDRRMGEQGYFLSIPLELLKKRQRIVSGILALGVAGAALCIFVAAGGIMNVMLANVVQRTREYGVRLACGADMSDIFFIVMGESLLLSLISGLLGIGLGAVAAMFVGDGLVALFPDALGLKPLYRLQDFLIPLMVSTFFGVVAGIVPALRAYRLDILTALRSE